MSTPHRTNPHGDPRADLLRELADPLRLRVVDRLGHGGPATPSRMAAELGVPAPLLSNHLRRLRDAGLVRVERAGRHAVYDLADPGLQALLPLLDRMVGRLGPARPRAPHPVPSRTCYDHLGGPLGVRLYDALLARDALIERPDGLVDLGPRGHAAFADLGVDVGALRPSRNQRFAFTCLDTTERAPHLAGALADALATALFARGWLERAGGGRAVRVTPAARSHLPGIEDGA